MFYFIFSDTLAEILFVSLLALWFIDCGEDDFHLGKVERVGDRIRLLLTKNHHAFSKSGAKLLSPLLGIGTARRNRDIPSSSLHKNSINVFIWHSVAHHRSRLSKIGPAF